MQKIKVSIIIVKYKAEEEFQKCLASLKNIKIPHEIIVVDNNIINRGYGRGNNYGVSKARGGYLFILNPDTVVLPSAVEKLVKFLDDHPKAGVVAPLLLDTHKQVYPLQGTRKLDPLSGIFSLSFINKLFPNNNIAQVYWLRDWDKKSERMVDVVPGTAFLIRKKVFDEVHGFDEKFFLYFEETDLCLRVQSLGWQIFIAPQAKLIHHWGRSTPKNAQIEGVFAASRFYYFRKHYGLFWAVLIHLICSLSFWSAIFWLSLPLGIFLRFSNLKSQTPFFGDQSWFYISARDALIQGKLPILGITSSITWLHQGPLYTYLLIPSLWLSNFNPFSGVIFILILSILSIFLMYILAGPIAATLLSLSSFAIFNSRIAYHTSPLPFFTILFLIFFKRKRNFLTGLFLGFLYQLHLLTFIFWPLVFFRFKPKIFIGFLLGITPFLIAGPVQTVGIFVWLSKHLITGFSGSTFSEAYKMVFLVPFILVLSFLIFRLPKNFGLIVLITSLLIINSHFKVSNYAPFLDERISSICQIPDDYLVWWLSVKMNYRCLQP